MRTGTWKSITTLLGLGTLLLTACDTEKGPEDPMLAGTGETEGATETEGQDPGATEGETDPGGSAEGQVPGDTQGEPPPGEPPPSEPEACSEPGANRECTAADGAAGLQFCTTIGDSVWGPCVVDPECLPGETMSCCGEGGGEGGSTGGSEGGTGGICDWEKGCSLYGGVPEWSDEDCDTPLVLSFDGAPAELVPARAATFDISGVGGCITSDWPTATTPWLALDVDASGTIDSGRELFGSGTLLRSGARASHGFMALAELDANGDGRIDGGDPAFSKLVLWGDDDGDRRSTFAEAQPVSQHQVLSIELGYHVDRQCDARGNCGVERAAFHFVDAHGAVRQGEVVDLHLACQ